MALFSALKRLSGLNSLSALDDHMLSDLGLCRHDIAEARSKGKATTAFLDTRRNERAGGWLS